MRLRIRQDDTELCRKSSLFFPLPSCNNNNKEKAQKKKRRCNRQMNLQADKKGFEKKMYFHISQIRSQVITGFLLKLVVLLLGGIKRHLSPSLLHQKCNVYFRCWSYFKIQTQVKLRNACVENVCVAGKSSARILCYSLHLWSI